SWWPDRVAGAFSSYFVYQPLGNLATDELESAAAYRRLHAAGDDDERERILTDLALAAAEQRGDAQWSLHRAFGRGRGVMLDVRASRHRDPAERRVVDHDEWAWTRRSCLDAAVDHLVIGSSLPAFRLPALHHLEGWNEAVARHQD